MSMGDSEGDLVPTYLGTMLALCAFSVLLNGIAIAVVLKYGRARSSIDIFLVNLSASDIMHAGVVLPIHFKNASIYETDFYGGDGVCRFIMFIPLFTIMGAISTIVTIAIERYRTMISRSPFNSKNALFAVAIIWVCAFVTSAPQLYEYSVYDRYDEEYNKTWKSCGSEGIPENFETIYASIVLVVAYIAPLLILIGCYTQILIFVWKHEKRFRATRMHQPQNQTNEQPRVAPVLTARKIHVFKLCILITVTFALMWAPYFVLFTLTEVSGTDDTSDFGDWPHLVGRTLTVLSTITNPLIYLFFNDTIRRDMARLLCCSWKCRPENEVSSRKPPPVSTRLAFVSEQSGNNFLKINSRNKIHAMPQEATDV